MAVFIKNSQNLFTVDREQFRAITQDLLSYAGLDRDLSILFTDNKRIQRINKIYFNRDRATNVISFSYMDGLPCEVVGDLVISLERAREEAENSGIPFYERIFSLIIHGLLHVQGFDHEKEKREAQRMRHREKKLLTYVRNHQLYKEPTV
ncbi:MAG TPA: rRNA maturation RNase YbeY [Syntrophorhabdales bacterium]|nr:rRNA maturation RNase YbeY [Syntrophorhabdales bacterium]